MVAPPVARLTVKPNRWIAIGLGGLIAGTLDLMQACILFGWKIPLVIAGGLLGHDALHGGPGTYILGLVLHYFIASTATAIYYGASRKWIFMIHNPLICGLFFGMAVELVMGYIVLPLSALHTSGPYELRDVLQGFLVHMAVVGVPVAYVVRKYSR